MVTSVPNWLMEAVFWLAARWDFLARWVNRIIVHRSVSMVPYRPDPYSTAHPYVSWTSLTDLTWSARHLPPKTLEVLPDPEKLIEIFRAPASGQVTCKKSTLLFPAFAQYLTDGIIRTVMPNASAGDSQALRKRNSSNHQFEMGALYGRIPAQTTALRLRSNFAGKKGLLKSQMIGGEEYAEFLYDEAGNVKQEFEVLDPVIGLDKVTLEQKKTLFAFGGDRANVAPQVSMLNTLFLREHNRLAAEIEMAHPDWDDERIFETARNTVIVLFIRIGIEEYVNHITPISFRLPTTPQVSWLAPWNKPNRIAIEFSLLYRWHSLIPATVIWGGKPYPVEDTLRNNEILLQLGMTRAFEEASAQSATRLGVRNSADSLLPLELAAIGQSRLCEVATFADYCRNTSTRPPQTFEDISTDPQVARLLADLYGKPENVEFYIGLFAQDTLKNSPLPDLMLKLAAMDAFSHAFTNPLLSERAFQESTFSEVGWRAIQETSRLEDVVSRNCGLSKPTRYIGVTRSDWTREYEIPVLDELREAWALRSDPVGRKKLFGFALSTVAEMLGLVLWLHFTFAGSPVVGFCFLVAGEAVEWSLLALAIATSPRSHPKKIGRIPRALLTSGLTSFSEAFLWVAWLALIPITGIFLSTALLLVAMHIKHVTEIKIFTGRDFFYHAWDARDITASTIEVLGAALWLYLATAISPILGAAVLFVVLSSEHLLQFKSAGFMALDRNEA